jgi:hypothetical protein
MLKLSRDQSGDSYLGAFTIVEDILLLAGALFRQNIRG